MPFLRALVVACLWLSAVGNAAAQVAPWRGNGPVQGSGIIVPGTIVPSLPRWGGGPPPPSPFDRPLPGMHSPSLPRPGVDLFRAGPNTYAPQFDQGSHRGDGRSNWRHDRVRGGREGRRRYSRTGTVPYPVGGVFVGASPYYYWPPAAVPASQPPITAPADEPEGFLRLLITPRTAGVWVDGIYEGTVDDFGGSGERPLPAGIHDVRVEADGFEPVEFEVRVPARDTITLRRDLERRPPTPAPIPPQASAPRPALEAPPAKPKTIYVIPRCYLGDSRPQQNQLPAGCSLADLKTLD